MCTGAVPEPVGGACDRGPSSKTNFRLYSYILRSLRAIVILLSPGFYIRCRRSLGLSLALAFRFACKPKSGPPVEVNWNELSRLATILLIAMTLNPLCPMVSLVPAGWLKLETPKRIPNSEQRTEMFILSNTTGMARQKHRADSHLQQNNTNDSHAPSKKKSFTIFFFFRNKNFSCFRFHYKA